MGDTIARDFERLPWLTDDVRRRPKKRSANWVVAFLAASAVAIIAALSFWLGMNGAFAPKPAVQTQPETRVDLPAADPLFEPAPIQPEPVMPRVEPAPFPAPVVIRQQEEVRIASASRRRDVVHRAKTTRPKAAAAAKKVPEKKTVAYSNPWKSDGVSGRMVRIGAYGSLEKGKKAWSQLAQLSPSFKRLPAVVTDLPSRTGRIYYWLQVGTTSQAHSEVLCQRMRSIGQSCLVVDLAGARGSGNERQPAGL
jgi:SPOR domain